MSSLKTYYTVLPHIILLLSLKRRWRKISKKNGNWTLLLLPVYVRRIYFQTVSYISIICFIFMLFSILLCELNINYIFLFIFRVPVSSLHNNAFFFNVFFCFAFPSESIFPITWKIKQKFINNFSNWNNSLVKIYYLHLWVILI